MIEELRADIAVIGGGLSGATAALRAAALGRDVMLVRKGYGATAVGSGHFDVLGSAHAETFGLLTADHFSPDHALAELFKRLPGHPYAALLEADGGPPFTALRARFDAASAFMLDRLAKAGHTLAGSLDKLTAHVTTYGTLRLTNLTPLSAHRGDVSRWDGARVACVGVEGVGAFDAPFVGRSFAELLRADRPGAIAALEPLLLRVPWARPGGGLLPVEVARDLDDPERRETFAAELSRALADGRFTHAVLAPLLGVERHAEILDLLARRTGIAVSEPLVPPPHAIHGLRMQKALDRALADSTVRVVNARARSFTASGASITSVEVEPGSADAAGEGGEAAARVRAERFVLATGRFLGGGLVGRGTVREAIFGLPVFHRGLPIGDRPVIGLLRPGYWNRQPLFDAGIRCDADRRPLGEDGRPAHGNLFAAGAILGGFDPALDGTGPGVDLLTGFAAGERAAEGRA
jgi:glycerol-3-phosphate dehydrogenase subunit B